MPTTWRGRLFEAFQAGLAQLRRRRGPCVVKLDDQGATCPRPDGTEERVAWDDLEAVEVRTTDAGPFVDDVSWVLHGGIGGCVVPSEAEGASALIERLQRPPGFDDLRMIEAMSSTDNATFLCWRRPEVRAGSDGAQTQG